MVSPHIESSDVGMFAATVEVRHDCPVGNVSRKLPALRVVQWCVNNRDLFQISGPENEQRAFREWVEEESGARHVSAGGDGVLLVTNLCRCATPGNSIGEAIRMAGAWDLPPIVYREGWESWRILVFGEPSVRELFKQLRARGELRIVSLRPIENIAMEKMMLIPAADVFSGITERQSSAILLGLEHGYYSRPSETSIDRLAQGVGLSASTFGEHLRKAEARILLNLRPHLEAYSTRMPGEVAVEDVRALTPRHRSKEAVPAPSS